MSPVISNVFDAQIDMKSCGVFTSQQFIMV